LDASPSTPSTTLLSAPEAKERLREIVEGFFFRRLRTEDGKRIQRLLVKNPPGLGKTREAIDWAIRYQAEQAGKDGTRLSLGDFNEACRNNSGWLSRAELDGAVYYTRSRGVGGEKSLPPHGGKRPRSGRIEAIPVCGERSALVCPDDGPSRATE
jgi:hypothetical protein